jgi:D-alanyl-lipoteichoic acid acyltransferase DltB (MBOAT superfamily)
MLFNSIEFLLFFPTVVGLFFLTPFKYRWLLLLAASYLFYGLANGWFLLLIIFSTLIDYSVGLKMSQYEDKKKRKPYLLVSLISNLGMLMLFKYFNFFNESFADLFRLLNLEYAIPALGLILPVGISFYTFQTLAYSIDIYNGKAKPERHFGIFSLYVTYFPQLVAGPIERSNSLIPQLKKKSALSYYNVTNGLKLMAWGFFKKVVIADQISPMIKHITDSPQDFYGLTILLCAMLFSYQIYCDFSGYSDIAIGAAQVMGVKLMVNFNRPFAAKNLADLWSRWHISLTTWFRDYVYIPIGGNRGGQVKLVRNVLIVFIVSGLWHGANYNFLIWGILNGVYVVVSILLMRRSKDKPVPQVSNLRQLIVTFFQKSYTFVLFSLFMLFFFPKDFSQSSTLIVNMFSNTAQWFQLVISNVDNARSELIYFGFGINHMIVLFLCIALLEVVQYYDGKVGSFRDFWNRKPIAIRWFGYLNLIVIIVLFSYQQDAPFYYFQF